MKDYGQEHVPDITAKDFTDYLESFNESMAPCPVCRGDDWIVPKADDGRPTTLLQHMDNDPSRRLMVFYIACKQCGFKRNFVAATVAMAIKYKQDPSSLGDL